MLAICLSRNEFKAHIRHFESLIVNHVVAVEDDVVEVVGAYGTDTSTWT